MSNYIITGASGFLGNNLAQELIDRGHKVTITLRTMKYLSAMYCKDAEVEYGDMRDDAFLNKIIKKDSIVIHCAGVMALGKEKKNEMFDVNYRATKELTNACIKNGAKKLVFVSSVDALWHYKGEYEISEPVQFEIDRLDTPYAQSKAMASKYVLDRAREGKINANVVYPTCLIGPGDYKISNIGQIILDYINNKRVFSIKGGSYNFVDVRDVVSAIIKISEEAPSGEDYILSGQDVTFKNMFNIIAEKLDKTKKPREMSVSTALFLSFFINLGKAATDKKQVYSPYYIKSFKGNHNFSNEKARKELEFRPRSIRDTFSDAIDWYKENKKDLIEVQE